MAKIPDSEIESARSDIVAVIESFNVQLEKASKGEFRALCPFHSEKSPSFTVTPNKGRYHCFGCGQAGTAIDFVMEYTGVDFREAVNRINNKTADTDNITPRAKTVIERDHVEVWSPRVTVPSDAPAPMDVINRNIDGKWVRLVADARWAYRDAAGALIGYIFRFNLPTRADGSSGGKEVVPQTYCTNSETGECNWRWLSFSKPRPMYGLDLLAAHPRAQVLVVEGEKTCDAARVLFSAAGVPLDKLIVVAWPGGGKAIKHVDWTALHGRSVALWPDADLKPYKEPHSRAGELMPFMEQPGTIAMYDIYNAISQHCAKIKLIIPPAGVPDGWDLADELPAGFNLLAHMKAGAQLAYETFDSTVPATAPLETEADIDTSEMPPPWDEGDAPLAAPAPATPATLERRTALEKRAEAHDKLESPALTRNGHFRMLGYDHDRYFILQHEKSQIMVYTKSDFSDSGLIELAPLDWWEEHFPGSAKTGGIDKKSAMNWMVRKANSRGIYDMGSIRGRGAWTDKGRLVFHHGDFLSVDGARFAITDFDSRYVYEMNRALPEIDPAALTCEEGRSILELAAVFRWAKPASAALLAGWVALAPLCGAIKWRPHVWITGGAGSGKSTVLDDFVHLLMNGMDLFAQGNSSEAGIRQELKGDALPVLFDESESNSERDAMRIQSVLSLIRQASTESQAKTLKGTAGGDAMAFHIRSMFCLASIQVGIKYQADIERMTVLALLPKRDDLNAADTWKRMSAALHGIRRDETLPARLVRRSLDLLPVTLKNIAVFSEAAAIKFGSQRDGDQYGTLMAGAWSLISREVADLDAALEMINMYDWSEHRENNEVDEGERALSALMGSLVRISGAAEVTVNELIRAANGCQVDGITMSNASAEAVLQRHGMRTEDGRLILSNTSNELKRLMQGTPFEADLRGVLLRVRGAERYERTIKFNGITSRAISLPLQHLLTDDDFDLAGAHGDEPLPF